MFRFRYNSYHKVITGLAIIVWAVYHFASGNESSEHYDNGQVKVYGDFENGKNHGKWIWYYENGQKKMEGTFQNGKREGLWMTWDRNGNQLTEGAYEADRLNGTYIRWNVEGDVVEHLVYKNDVEVER